MFIFHIIFLFNNKLKIFNDINKNNEELIYNKMSKKFISEINIIYDAYGKSSIKIFGA